MFSFYWPALLPHLSKIIANFFNKTDPIRASMISASTMFIIFIICIHCACKLFCPSFIPACCITNICRRHRTSEPFTSGRQKAARRYKRAKPKDIAFNPTEASAPMIEQTEQLAKNLKLIRNIQGTFPNSFQ